MNLAFSLGVTGSGICELQDDGIDVISVEKLCAITLQTRALYEWNIRRICDRVKHSMIERLERESYSVLVDLSQLGTFDLTQKRILDALITISQILYIDSIHSVNKIIVYVADYECEHILDRAISELVSPSIPTEVYSSFCKLRSAFSDNVAGFQPP